MFGPPWTKTSKNLLQEMVPMSCRTMYAFIMLNPSKLVTQPPPSIDTGAQAKNLGLRTKRSKLFRNLLETLSLFGGPFVWPHGGSRLCLGFPSNVSIIVCDLWSRIRFCIGGSHMATHLLGNF